MNDLAMSMWEAWATKASLANLELAAIAAAPALFKPEYVAEVEAQRERAVHQMRRWEQ